MKLKKCERDWEYCGVGGFTLKLKERQLKTKKHTYLFGVCLPLNRINDVPFFEGERSMEYEIFPIPDLYYE